MTLEMPCRKIIIVFDDFVDCFYRVIDGNEEFDAKYLSTNVQNYIKTNFFKMFEANEYSTNIRKYDNSFFQSKKNLNHTYRLQSTKSHDICQLFEELLFNLRKNFQLSKIYAFINYQTLFFEEKRQYLQNIILQQRNLSKIYYIFPFDKFNCNSISPETLNFINLFYEVYFPPSLFIQAEEKSFSSNQLNNFFYTQQKIFSSLSTPYNRLIMITLNLTFISELKV
eukprot:snap_masked-scaffold_17-processed-gene-4.32-mRNA-1 protein AED:1.00 eAED:1.00 QI:0/0/0/0/1/1/2/0/224